MLRRYSFSGAVALALALQGPRKPTRCHLPGCAAFQPCQDFAQATLRRLGRGQRQLIEGKEILCRDLRVESRHPWFPPIGHKQCNVIAGKLIKVRIDPKQLSRRDQNNARLFVELACKGFRQRFAACNPAAREVPACGVAMTNQKNAPVLVEHDALDTDGHNSASASIWLASIAQWPHSSSIL